MADRTSLIVSDLIEEEKRRQASEVNTSLTSAMSIDPEAEARYRHMQQATGFDLATIRADNGAAAKRYSTLVTGGMLPAHAPATANYLANQANAQIAHDSIGDLSWSEKFVRGFNNVTDYIVKQWKSGQQGVVLGKLDYSRATGDKSLETYAKTLPLASATEEAQKVRDRSILDKMLGGSLNFLGQQYEMLKEALPYGTSGLAAGTGAALLTGPGAPISGPALGTLGFTAGMGAGYNRIANITETGNMYRKLDKVRGKNGEQISEPIKQNISAAYGALSSLVESMSFGFLSAPYVKYAEREAVKKGIDLAVQNSAKELLAVPTKRAAAMTFLKDWEAAKLSESAEEAIQQALEAAGTYAAKKMSTGEFKQDTWAEVGADIGKAFVDTYLAMVIPGVGGPALNLRTQLSEVKRAEHNAAIFQAFGENLSESKLYQRLPESIREHIEEVQRTHGGPVENVYIDAARFDAMLRNEGVSPNEVAKQIFGDDTEFVEALQNGNELVIPLGVYAEKIAGSNANTALFQDLRVDGQELTYREAQEYRDNIDAVIKEIQQQAADESKNDNTYQDLYDLLYKQQVDAGRPDAEAKYTSLVMASTYVKRAADMTAAGNPMTAMEMYQGAGDRVWLNEKMKKKQEEVLTQARPLMEALGIADVKDVEKYQHTVKVDVIGKGGKVIQKEMTAEKAQKQAESTRNTIEKILECVRS